MYNTNTSTSTSAADLERIANDLDQIAKKYTDGSQQLDQHVTSLDGATSQLLSGGAEQWKGVSSEAFHSAYLERRTRMQQASQMLSQSAQYLTQFAQIINEHLSTIRADQSVMQGQSAHMLAPDDQASIMNEESQAQNAIITALAALNSQLEGLAEEVRDCPQEQQEDNYAGGGPNSINKSDNGSDGGDAGGGQGGDKGASNDVPLVDANNAQIDPAKFEKYSMDPNNPQNRGKWKAFEELGYDVHSDAGRASGAQNVMEQLQKELPETPAKPERITDFGPRFRADVPVHGPNGQEGTLVTIWQYDTGSTSPRMITNWLEVHK